MIETLAKDHFIDALQDTDTKWRVYQSRPASLSDAVVVAVELEAFHLAETKKGNLRRPTARAVMTEDTTNKVEDRLQQLVETLTKGFEGCVNKIDSKLALYDDRLRQSTAQSATGTGYGNQCVQNSNWREDRRPPPKCWNLGRVGHIKRNCPDPQKKIDNNRTDTTRKTTKSGLAGQSPTGVENDRRPMQYSVREVGTDSNFEISERLCSRHSRQLSS
ncbi:hypothetical protein BSL78_26356 [Apostichopus japonicus]|uniref:CCHC-type domain-containing protein n=1 Tax=Stichopus japonicus TaxID=307972 RepID=A0A2G8JM49_STIJA|nr:hypothetical protein BSL78_26356 [Apostichopus japonicus]